MTARPLWTHEDDAALPEDGKRCEIHNGELCARDIEALVLTAGEYTVAARVSGERPVDLSPLTDLGLVPDSLWPDESLLTE